MSFSILGCFDYCLRGGGLGLGAFWLFCLGLGLGFGRNAEFGWLFWCFCSW